MIKRLTEVGEAVAIFAVVMVCGLTILGAVVRADERIKAREAAEAAAVKAAPVYERTITIYCKSKGGELVCRR